MLERKLVLIAVAHGALVLGLGCNEDDAKTRSSGGAGGSDTGVSPSSGGNGDAGTAGAGGSMTGGTEVGRAGQGGTVGNEAGTGNEAGIGNGGEGGSGVDSYANLCSEWCAGLSGESLSCPSACETACNDEAADKYSCEETWKAFLDCAIGVVQYSDYQCLENSDYLPWAVPNDGTSCRAEFCAFDTCRNNFKDWCFF